MQEKMYKYARLCLKIGVNLQKGEELVINSPIECAEFTRILSDTAYKLGAKFVTVFWNDEKLDKITLEWADKEVLSDIPDWKKQAKMHYAKNKANHIRICAEDPEIFKDIASEKVNAFFTAKAKAFKEYSELAMKNDFAWLVICAPSLGWAKKVFCDKSDDVAMSQLWEMIFKINRVYDDNPEQSWTYHQDFVKTKVNFLNDNKFESLHFKNSLGTDITIGLADNHLWSGVGDVASNGKQFIANMPTEEVYTLPHKDKINGTVYNSKPLNHNGNIIDNFYITYKNGKVTDYDAKIGKEILKDIIETDRGTLSLGEVALVPFDSPISNTGILFFNTLYDENASCHFAIGKGYPSCIENGEQMDKDELIKMGLNDSIEHIDFMFGTNDLSVEGKNKNGEIIKIFENGNWSM